MGGDPALIRSHTHHHTVASHHPRSALLFSLALTGGTLLAELWGARQSGSVALLSDAGHVLMDFTGLLFSLFALQLAERPATNRHTFGLHRMEVLAALLNGVLVAGVALWIGWEAVARAGTPAAPRLGPMVGWGSVGLISNLVVAWKLHGPSQSDLNLRASFLHVASDALSSVGVIAGGVLIAVTGWTFLDAWIGLGIAGLIFVNAARLLWDTSHLLLEGVPPSIEKESVSEALRRVEGVVRVEDLHIWGLCSHLLFLSAHITVTPEKMGQQKDMLLTLDHLLREQFCIGHVTVQLESADWSGAPQD